MTGTINELATDPLSRSRIGMPWLVLAFVILSSPVFFLFSYNSSYGFDEVEYLVIGRSLADGYRFLDFIPSKGIAIYALLAAVYRTGVTVDHATVSVLITAVYVAILATTWPVARRVFGVPAAVLTTLLVAGCVVFMELNFLQPTGFVYMAGLAAFALWVRNERLAPTTISASSAGRAIACGSLLAAGFHFKSIAALYGVGLAAYTVVVGLRRRSIAPVVHLFLAGAGCVAGIAVVWLYFLCTGRGAGFWIWTVTFPLFNYPSNTYFITKPFTKLLWFHGLFFAALAASLHPRLRGRIWQSDPALAAFCMGAFAYIALLKTQSSHYCFPGAAFFSLWIAYVMVEFAQEFQIRPRVSLRTVTVIAAALGVVVFSGAIYRPDAVWRLVGIKKYAIEKTEGDYLVRHVSTRERALLLTGGQTLYHLSLRYPNVPFVNTEVQTSYYLLNHPNTLVHALDDQKLSLVVYDERNPGFDDPLFLTYPQLQQEMAAFTRELHARFQPAADAPEGMSVWIRSPASH